MIVRDRSLGEGLRRAMMSFVNDGLSEQVQPNDVLNHADPPSASPPRSLFSHTAGA